MAIDYDALMATRVDDELCVYTEKDAMLYALGVGFGSDPLDRKELPYVFEGATLKTVPTLASMLLPSNFLDECGWIYDQVLHTEMTLDLYRPLPPSARLLINRRVIAVHDRGAKKGAKIRMESEVRLAKNDTVLFTLGNTLLARGDGGFGGAAGENPSPHRLPKREADLVCDLRTRPDQALLFRLSGDLNPLHADPDLAIRLGFDAPLLHGRSTCGVACRAILMTICDYDFTLISGFDVRFTAPVFPGDLITTEMWQEGNIVSFRCLVKARNTVVLNNGKCTLRA